MSVEIHGLVCVACHGRTPYNGLSKFYTDVICLRGKLHPTQQS